MQWYKKFLLRGRRKTRMPFLQSWSVQWKSNSLCYNHCFVHLTDVQLHCIHSVTLPLLSVVKAGYSNVFLLALLILSWLLSIKVWILQIRLIFHQHANKTWLEFIESLPKLWYWRSNIRVVNSNSYPTNLILFTYWRPESFTPNKHKGETAHHCY